MSQTLLPTLQVSLLADTGLSISDRITKDARLKVEGVVEGAQVQYSINGKDWTETLPIAVQGLNSVYVRQINSTGGMSNSSFLQFTLDTINPLANLQLALRSDTGLAADLITRDGTLMVANVGAGHRIEYSSNGIEWLSKQPVTVEGQNTVWVRQVDVAGNASSAQSINFVFDSKASAPIVALLSDTGVLATDRLTSNAALKVTGLEANAKVQYSSNGTVWTDNAPTTVEGVNIVYVRQIDVTGNTSSATKFSFVLDTTAAAAPVVGLLNDNGVSSSDRITTDGRLNITGLETGATAQYSHNGTDWSNTAPTALLGQNTVYVRQIDKAGNASLTSALSFNLISSQVPPTPEANLQLTLNNDTGVAGDLVSRDGTLRVVNVGAGNRIEYSSDGTLWANSQPVVIEGQNTVYVRQVNSVGNTSSAQTLNFRLDTTVATPVVALVKDTGLATDRVTSNANLAITGVEAGAVVQYSTNGALWTNTAPVAVQGLNSVYVRQVDVAGNISSSSFLQFTLDNIASAANLQLALRSDTGVVGDLISRDGTLRVTNVASSNRIEYSTNGTLWSSSQPATVEGQNSVWVRQVDVAGNASTAQRIDFIRDTKAAAAPTLTLSNDTGMSGTDRLTSNNAFNVTGVESGATVQYSTNGTVWGTTAPTAVQGLNVVYVRQIDVAGNISQSKSTSYVFDNQVSTLSWALLEDTGTSNTDRITRNSTVNVLGLEAGATWSYQMDGSGAWIAGVGSSFKAIDGEHSYVLRQTDKAGNVAYTNAFTVNAILEPDAISVQMIDSNGDVVSNGFSNDANSVLRLSGDSSDTWQYRYVDPVNGHGEWQDVSGSEDISLLEGTYNVETRKIDVAGNFVSALSRVKIDTTAAIPTMTFVEDTGMVGDGISTNALVDISGLEGQSVWEVRIDDSPYWNTTTVASNQFKLLVGTHTYYIRQTDKAGNVSEIGEYTFTYQSAVAQPTLSLDVDTGVSTFDLVTNQSLINVNGLLPDAIWQYQIDENGQWLDGSGTSFDMLTDGQSHHYAVRQQSGGIWSEPTTLYAVRFDNTAPNDFTVNLAVDSGISNNDGITNQSNVLLNDLEVGARFEYRVDGGAWQGFEVDSTSATLNLEVGTHNYEFRQQDTAGNFANIITRTYTYINADLVAPTIVLNNDTGDLSTDKVTNAGQINVTLSVVGAGVRWQYQVDNGQWLDGSGSSFMAQAGTHSYRVRQLDTAGNVSPASDALSINFDTTAPTFNSASSVKVTDADSERVQLISNSQVLYTASASDSSGISSYSMADNDIFNFDPLSRQLTFKQPIGYRVDSDNTYSAVLTATDIAGNTTEKTVNVEVMRTNTSAPAIELGELKTGLQLNPSGARTGLSAFVDNTLAIGTQIYNSTTETWLKIPVRYNTQGVELNRFTPPFRYTCSIWRRCRCF